MTLDTWVKSFSPQKETWWTQIANLLRTYFLVPGMKIKYSGGISRCP